jgi:YidC/Oxa1 family membrane protein insertase
MEMTRNILLGGVLITAFLLWTAWQQDYKQPDVAESVVTETMVAGDVPDMVLDETPSATRAADTKLPINVAAVPNDRIVRVTTDVLAIEIDRKGGNLISAELLNYKQSNEPNSQPVQILTDAAGETYVAQSGLLGERGPDTAQTGQAILDSAQSTYIMSDDQDVLTVPLIWSENGITVTKNFSFERGSYLIDVNYEVKNQSSSAWVGQFYGQFKREQITAKKDNFFSFATFNGAAISTPDKRYQKLSYKDMGKENINKAAAGGWIAMLQHYFVSAWIPNPEQSYRFITYTPQNNMYRLAMLGPTLAAEPGQSIQTGARFYVGPEITEDLKKIAPGLDLTVDYGWFWPISQALFWVLKKFYDLFGNWGWAIIFTTVVIKLVFFKLSATSYRSMANMRRVQPKIEKIKERVGDDRQKMSQEMMALYKKEKINPLGGCLPILVQIPVFIALYWVLIESVELRHAPFILWIHDLSAKDPFYVLPIIMGVSMFLQQRMSPAPPDPVQAKVLMMMPIIFTVLFLNFPAGLVLYWVVNNLLSIAQQWTIMRSVEKVSQKSKS